MSRLLLVLSVFISLNASAFNVTFRLNMNGLDGFSTPELNGTFNNWCGNCNPMSDVNSDGIWETTISIEAGIYEYKFSIDNWAGQENLSAASNSCLVSSGTFNNRFLFVGSDMILDVACWGLCEPCIEPDTTNWNLTWSDEFEGSELNTSHWAYETGNSGWGNNELQYYTSSSNNLSVNNGILSITAREVAFQGSNYTSARIVSNNLVELQYGKIEARIKVPSGQGIWPAFWMLGANYETVGWPQCGEIDVMEHVNNELLTNATVHWDNLVNHAYKGSSVPFDPSIFHVYGVIWDDVQLIFTIDNHPYYRYRYADYTNAESIFQKPFFFLLNVAVGGNWPGNPDLTTQFPATMEVDYVRAYSNNSAGLGQIQSPLSCKVYPQPFQESFYLSVPEEFLLNSYRIYSMQGKLIESGTVDSPTKMIQTEHWTSGLYHLQVCSKNKILDSVRICKE